MIGSSIYVALKRFFLVSVLLAAAPLLANVYPGGDAAKARFDEGSGGGSNVGNGGGLAEAHIAYIFLSLDEFTQLCKSMPACGGTAEEIQYLDELVNQTRDERALVKPRFKSSKDDPGFFLVNGVERSFRTEGAPGSEIWFNLDKIYVTDSSDVVKALPMTDLFQIALSAFAVHVPGSLTAETRENLFRRLAQIPNGRLLESHSPWVGHARQFGAVAYVERVSQEQVFNVAVSDHTAAFDQNDPIRQALRSAILPLVGNSFEVRKSRALQVAWQTPIFSFNQIRTSLLINSVIETESMNGVRGSYRCQFTLSALFYSTEDGIDRIYYLDTQQSRWDATCN